MRVLGFALVLSVATNVWLWTTKSRSSTAVAVSPVNAPEETSALAFTVPKIEVAETRDYANVDRVELEQRVVRTEARIEELRPASERFPRFLRSIETEARVMPFLDRIFKTQPGAERRYRVECRGAICKLDTEVDWGEWMEPLQTTYPDRLMFRGFSFGTEGTFVELAPPEAFLRSLEATIRRAFFASSDTKACLASKARGELHLDVWFESTTRGWTVTAAGELASHPVGVCLRAALETLVADVSIPPEIAARPAFSIMIELPLDAHE